MARPGSDAAVRRLGRSRPAVWAAFAAVHGWLAYVGVVLMPQRAFWDLDLYRYWATLALDHGRWPVLDDPWVYPPGALVPVLAPALAGARSTAGYSLAWCVLVAALDALAVAVLLRTGTRRAAPVGAWWWLAFLALLGPVAVGRLDAVVAPLSVVALALARRRPAAAAVLLTAGAWVKVGPGALLLPLLATARRPVRTVVGPAAAVCAVVVGTVAAGGGLSRVLGFVTEQGRRGLQVESVAATPWVLAGLVDDRVRIGFDTALFTWEIEGPGTAAVAGGLGWALPLATLALAVLLLRARHHDREQDTGLPGPAGPAGGADVLLWGALAAATLLIVVNKVGSPQFVGWLAPPVVVALTAWHGLGARDRRAWTTAAAAVLAVAALTQLVFPVGADGVVSGDPWATGALAARNVGLVVVLGLALRALWPHAVSRPAA